MQFLAITLEWAKKPTRESMIVKITAKNTSNEILDWDRAFSFFLEWQIDGHGGKVYLINDHMANKPDPLALPSRFIGIKPGETVSTELDIMKQMRLFAAGHSSDGEPTGFEYYGKVAMDNSVKTVAIKVKYIINSDKVLGFKLWCQKDLSAFRICKDRVESNVLKINF
jgi:hypothetical protein